MKQDSALWQAAGFAFTTLAGSLLHFLYDWTGGSPLAAPFSGINESTWEHMKLMFWPLFLFAVVQRMFFTGQDNFWWVKLAQMLMALGLIPVLFYTWNGMFGRSPDWVNIGIFYVSAGAAFLLERGLFRQVRTPIPFPLLPFAAICLIGAAFCLFTFAPPGIPLFLDPR